MTVKHELTQELMAEMPPKLEYFSMVLAVVIENLYTEWTVKMEEIHMQPAMLVLQPLMEM